MFNIREQITESAIEKSDFYFEAIHIINQCLKGICCNNYYIIR